MEGFTAETPFTDNPEFFFSQKFFPEDREIFFKKITKNLKEKIRRTGIIFKKKFPKKFQDIRSRPRS
jgi:hypothetical protein